MHGKRNEKRKQRHGTNWFFSKKNWERVDCYSLQTLEDKALQSLTHNYILAMSKFHNQRNYPSEARLAKLFKKNRLFNFFRNYPLANRFFGDFVFPEGLLVVEYDGKRHEEDPKKIARDSFKDMYLTQLGFRVIRANRKTDFDRLVAMIKDHLMLHRNDTRYFTVLGFRDTMVTGERDAITFDHSQLLQINAGDAAPCGPQRQHRC